MKKVMVVLALSCSAASADTSLGVISQPTLQTIIEKSTTYTDTATLAVTNGGASVRIVGYNLCAGGGRGNPVNCIKVTVDAAMVVDGSGNEAMAFTKTEECYVYSCAYRHDVQSAGSVLPNGLYYLTWTGTVYNQRYPAKGGPIGLDFE